MSTSLAKFRNRRTDANGKPLHWGRAAIDGAPFRGHSVPMLTEDEYDDRIYRAREPHAEFFDISDSAELAAYLDVWDGIHNGWYRLTYIERFWKGTTRHYVEWVQYYLEDGQPTPYLSPRHRGGHTNAIDL